MELDQGFNGHHQPCWCPDCRTMRGPTPPQPGRKDSNGVWHPAICRCEWWCAPHHPDDSAHPATPNAADRARARENYERWWKNR